MTISNENKGYGMFTSTGSSFYINEASHIEKIDELDMFEDDDAASIQAEKDGIRFIYGMDGVPDRVYIDTEENRTIISKWILENPIVK